MGCQPSKQKVDPVPLLEASKLSLTPSIKQAVPKTRKKSVKAVTVKSSFSKKEPTPSQPNHKPQPQPAIVPEKYLLSTAPDFSAQYNVVSHVWGSVSPQPHRSNRPNLLVSSPEKLSRITNLADTTKIPLWVDFYSIDQSSTSDKCHQIGIMGEIYTRAEKTYVCLTCPEKRALDALVGTDFERAEICRSGRKYKGEDCTEIRDRVSKYSRALNVYNSRVWTLQEAILSRDLVYTCCCLNAVCSRTMVSRRGLLNAIQTVANFYRVNAPHEMITAQLRQYREDVGVVLGDLDRHQQGFKKRLVQFLLSRGCSQIQDYYFGIQAVAPGSLTKFEYTTDYKRAVGWLAAYTFPLICFDDGDSDGANWFVPNDINVRGMTMQEVFRITGTMNSEPTTCDIHADTNSLTCSNVSVVSPHILGLATRMEVLDFAYNFGTQPYDNLAGKYNNNDQLHIAVSQLVVLIASETGLMDREPDIDKLNIVFDYLDRGARRYGYFGFCNELQHNKMSISISARSMTRGINSGTHNKDSIIKNLPSAKLCDLLTVVLWGMRMSEDGWYNPFPSKLWKTLSESLAFACSSVGLIVSFAMDGSITINKPSKFSARALYAMKVGVAGRIPLLCLTTEQHVLNSELICLGGSWFMTKNVSLDDGVCTLDRVTPVFGVYSHESAYSKATGIEVSQSMDHESLVVKMNEWIKIY
ncbi:UNVERIFIED_CONTAM: hypothetical protein HDU68_011545 [Siphonaria sp. JEL0065]|nr:hypothetical protein HDU68_011545 [Siphonaria sp. JEL0065]